MHRDFSIRIILIRLRSRLNLTQIGFFFWNSRPCLLSLHSTSNLVLNVYSSKKSTDAWTQMKTRSFCTLQKKITCKTALFKHVTDSVFIIYEQQFQFSMNQSQWRWHLFPLQLSFTLFQFNVTWLHSLSADSGSQRCACHASFINIRDLYLKPSLAENTEGISEWYLHVQLFSS